MTEHAKLTRVMTMVPKPTMRKVVRNDWMANPTIKATASIVEGG